MQDTQIIIDWVKDETINNIVVKESNKRFWKILNYVFCFFLGFFLGFLLCLLILSM
jgi:quinol-cytochrome oxidoreductase complex cytochrome b subunit